MPRLIDVTFSGDSVGLIVRGKKSQEHDPHLWDQHADCVKSNGEPIGFYGGPGQGSSGSMSGSSGTGSSGAMGGAVYDFDSMTRNRLRYVDGQVAVKENVVSGVMQIPVSADVARKFDGYWDALKEDPKAFFIVGGNCSTRASGAFIYAGIISGGIPGLDTPDNLWRQLWKVHRGKATAVFGYVTSQPRRGGAGGYSLTVQQPG